MPNVNVQFNGKVGQTIVGGSIGRIDTTIEMGQDGDMVVISTVTDLNDNQ
jgi:hypothetical protein